MRSTWVPTQTHSREMQGGAICSIAGRRTARRGLRWTHDSGDRCSGWRALVTRLGAALTICPDLSPQQLERTCRELARREGSKRGVCLLSSAVRCRAFGTSRSAARDVLQGPLTPRSRRRRKRRVLPSNSKFFYVLIAPREFRA